MAYHQYEAVPIYHPTESGAASKSHALPARSCPTRAQAQQLSGVSFVGLGALLSGTPQDRSHPGLFSEAVRHGLNRLCT